MNQEIVLRPRFELSSAKKAEEIIQCFKTEKEKKDKSFLIKIVDAHIFIDVLKKDSHFWSPQLHLEILENDGQTKVKGLFGPKPQIWTFFMFLHFAVALAFICFAIWAYMSYSLDKEMVLPIIMLVVLPILWFLLYFIGRLGKDFGKSQMKKQHQFLVNILKN